MREDGVCVCVFECVCARTCVRVCLTLGDICINSERKRYAFLHRHRSARTIHAPAGVSYCARYLQSEHTHVHATSMYQVLLNYELQHCLNAIFGWGCHGMQC